MWLGTENVPFLLLMMYYSSLQPSGLLQLSLGLCVPPDFLPVGGKLICTTSDRLQEAARVWAGWKKCMLPWLVSEYRCMWQDLFSFYLAMEVSM